MTTTPQILGNRYEIGELLGRGGMAQVHLGRDTRLGRTVAVKLLRSDLTQDPLFQARFKREAQSSAGLNHPAIVAVYDTGEETITDARGVTSSLPFIVMEYVQGHTLREMVTEGQTLDVETALRVTSGVLSALEYSHQAGIVHRDIKPANVMVTQAGDVKVMDFGIARAMSDATNGMTQTQAVIGTAQYLSPEQARGETVDTRSDLYSTGCMLFELLTGRPPFVADSPVAVAYQHVREMPQPPSSFNPAVPEVVDRIVLHSLVKERDDRYQTAADFRSDIRAALAGHGVMAPVQQPGFAGPPAQGGYNPTGATEFYTGAMPPQGQPGYYGPGATGAMTGFGSYPMAEDKTQRNTLIVIVGAAVAAVLLVVALVMSVNSPEDGGDSANDPADTVITDDPAGAAVQLEIPSLVGLSTKEARDALEKAGFPDPELEYEVNAEQDGKVISQSPAKGTKVDKNDVNTTSIVITIGKKPDVVNVTVPDLTGMTQAEAIAKLREVGFSYGGWFEATEDMPTGPANTAVATSPAIGTEVPKGEEVQVYYSKGEPVNPPDGGDPGDGGNGGGNPAPTVVKVPNLANKDKATASSLLTDAGLLVGTCTYKALDPADPANAALEGLVVSQSAAADSDLAEGEAVNFQIGTIDPAKPEGSPCT